MTAAPIAATPAAAPETNLGLPILKWVGGKARLLRHLTPLYTGQGKIIEPFFGGGALSFHLASQRPGLQVVGNDMLAPVVEIYEAVRRDVEAFIAQVNVYAGPYLALEGKDSRRAFYYQVRARYLVGEVDGPAVLFFMLWCAYSGLYRTGKTHPGRFNTSHGFGLEKDDFYHADRLRGAAAAMARWQFTSTDFAQVLDAVDADSLVFLDPPYRETYTGYTGEGFSEADQLRVVDFFKASHARGARVAYTNKDVGDGFYDEHFAGFTISRVPIRYQVNRNAAEVGRPLSFEVLIHN